MPDKWVCTLTCSSSNKALVCTMHALTAQAKQARAGGKGGAAAAVPSGDDEIMKKVFLNYCKYTVGQGRSTFAKIHSSIVVLTIARYLWPCKLHTRAHLGRHEDLVGLELATQYAHTLKHVDLGFVRCRNQSCKELLHRKAAAARGLALVEDHIHSYHVQRSCNMLSVQPIGRLPKLMPWCLQFICWVPVACLRKLINYFVLPTTLSHST